MDRESFEEMAKNSPTEALMVLFDEAKKAGLFDRPEPEPAAGQ